MRGHRIVKSHAEGPGCPKVSATSLVCLTSLFLFLLFALTFRAAIAQLVYRWATGWKIGVLGFGNSSAEVKECVELYLHSPVRLHGVVLS